jgi:VanZ family protein
VYVLLIIYASLYPFSWSPKPEYPFAYLLEPSPRYWTWFDILTNVAGYIPLGVLMVAALSPAVRGATACLLSVLAGIALSLTMETTQVYLPGRVPSRLDLLTNAGGSLAGALMGMVLTPLLLHGDRAHRLLQRWLRSSSSRVLIVPMLWLVAQLYPQNYLFGHGQVLSTLSGWIPSLPTRATFIRAGTHLSVEQYWLSETIITASGMVGGVLVFLYVLDKSAPRLLLAILLLLSALSVKVLACALLYTPGNALVWLTPGAAGGMLVGLLMLSGLVFTHSAVQRRIGIFLLLGSLFLVNTLPDNQYFLSTLQTWSQGKFLNFNGMTRFVASIWPFVALGFLFLSVYNTRHHQ